MGTPVGSLDELFSSFEEEEGTEGTEAAATPPWRQRAPRRRHHRPPRRHHLPPRWHHRPPPSCQAVTGDPPRRPSRPERRQRGTAGRAMTDASRRVARDGRGRIRGRSGALRPSRPLTGSLVAMDSRTRLYSRRFFVALLTQHGAVLRVDGQLIGTASPPRSLSRAATRSRPHICQSGHRSLRVPQQMAPRR